MAQKKEKKQETPLEEEVVEDEDSRCGGGRVRGGER